MENKIDYLDEYSKFEEMFRRTETSGEEIGEIIMRMGGYYARRNIELGVTLRKFSVIKADFQNQADPATGKPTSTSKAEILANATEEATLYQMARIHVNNIQEIMNCLKALQRGTLNEYANTV